MKCFKRLMCAALSTVMLASTICFSGMSQVFAAEVIPVYLNGTLMQFPANDAQPQIYQNRTYVPIRKTAEYLGLSINWNSKTETLTFSREGLTIDHTMRSNIVYVSGNPLTFDTRSINVQNRTLMPIRMLGESVGATVEWNNEQRAVYITTEAAQQKPEPQPVQTAKPVIQNASVSKNTVSSGENVKLTVVAKDATKIILQDSDTKKEIETISEYTDSADGTRTFEALIKADNETGESVIKGINVIPCNDTKNYDSVEDIRNVIYIVTAEEIKSDKKDKDDDDDNKKDEIKSDYMKSYKLDSKLYQEGDYAVLTVVTTDDVERVKVTNNYSNTKAEASKYDEKKNERTFTVKTKLTKKGSLQLNVCLYIKDEGYESVTQKIPVKVEEDDEKTYDDIEIVDVELMNDVVYDGEKAYVAVYTSTDVEEVAILDDDDKKVAKTYYNSGKADGKLVWYLDFEVNHTDKVKYTVVAYNKDDETDEETIKIEGEGYSKNDLLVLSVEQKSTSIREGDTARFSVKCTNDISYVVFADDRGSEIARETSGSKSGSYRTFTVKAKINDLDDDYYIYGYDKNDNKESTYRFHIFGEQTEDVEILKVDVENDTVDEYDDIELTVETTTNVKKLYIVDDDDDRVYKKNSPTDETNSKYIWEISFDAEDEGRYTYTIVVEDEDDNTDEWSFNIRVRD